MCRASRGLGHLEGVVGPRPATGKGKMKGIRNVRFVSGATALSAAVFAGATPASGALIAAWNFNAYDGNAHSIAADHGVGALTIAAGWPDGDLRASSGTVLNAFGGDPAGTALRLSSANNNGLFIEFAISTVGLEDLVLTFATAKNTQGFHLNQFAYSTNGGSTFTNFGGTYDPTTSFTVLTFDFSGVAALDNNSQAVIRIKFDGATNNGGRNEIDNVQVNATAIPEPGTIALLSAAALIGFRRRRRA